jgi:DNA-binding SARP family transcriptional activator/tetratricopeptide (TPR) repeat protein
VTCTHGEPTLDVQILGPLRVLRDGVEVDLGRPKQRLLLAVLVAASGDTVSVDRLVDELWGDDPPPRVASSVQAYVSKLRTALEPDRPARAAPRLLVTRAPGYALVLPPDALDATRFAGEADEVRRLLQAGRFEGAHALAGQALARWRGAVLADLADNGVAQREATRWDSLRLAVTEDRLHAAIELGLHTTAISDLEALVADHPLRERSLGLLLRALYLGGRPVEALERYRAYRTYLQEELGLDPGPGLRAVEAAILRQDPTLLPTAPRTRPMEDPTAPVTDRSAEREPMPDRSAPGATPDLGGFVGRTEELQLGATIVDDVRAGRPRWLTLAGEPGIGKTRLAEAIADRAAAAGVEVAWGRCHEDDDAPAYWPWSQLLRGVVPDATDPIATLLAEVSSPDPATQRYRLHERVTELLLAREPRLLIVDDAQWADPASLQLLEFLAVQIRGGHLGVLLTVRSGASAGPGRAGLRASLTAIARHPGATHRELGPLGPAELAELSSLVTGAEPAPEEVAALHERSAGNPFFATELLRLPAHRGGRAEPPLPAAVREVIERRLAPLGDDVRATLDLAAVVGASFDLPVLEGASGMDPDRLFDALDLAVASGLVVPADGGVGAFRFSHALVRDTLLADLSPMRQQRTHARVAEAIEHRPRRDPARHAAELAYHLVAAAGVVGQATACAAAERAAVAAEGRLAFEEAAGWWSTARDLLTAQDDAAAADRVGVALGRALLLAGRIDDGRAALCEVMDDADRRGDAVAEATAGIAVALSGGAWYWVRPGESPSAVVARLERAATALGEIDHPLRIGLLVTTAQGVYYADPDRAIALVDEALAIARRLGDPRLLATALVGAMGGDWGPDSRERHLERSAELLTLPLEVRPPDLELAARLWRLTAHVETGDLDAADAELAEADAVAEASGRQILRAQVAIARIGLAWLGDGGLAAVEAAVVRAAELHRRSGLYGEDAVPLANRLVTHLLRGDVAGLGDVLPLASQVGAFGNALEAVDRLVAGDRDGAITVLAAAPGVPRTWQWLGAHVLRAILIVHTGAVELAAPVRDALAPRLGTVAVAGTTMSAYGPVAYHLGELDLLLGDLAAATDHLRAAVEHADALGARIWAALARVALGEALDRAGDRDAARALLERGRDEARRLGLAAAADRAGARLRVTAR